MKSRIGLKRLVLLTAPRYWSFKEKCFIENPQLTHSSGLFINTELDLTEISQIVWATISGVAENKIIEDELTVEERERVQEAIQITKEMKLFIETNDDYDCAYLDYIVSKHVNEHQVSLVVLDYIELTGSLVAEYTAMSRGIGARTDQVLLNLSANLKAIARRYQVALLAFTQVSENARRDITIRNAGAIAESKSIQNKADYGATFFYLTKEENVKIEPLINRLGLHVAPNGYYHIYKNRGGIIKNAKVFVYQDLSTMEVVDCFVTDGDFAPINVDKTKIEQVLLEK